MTDGVSVKRVLVTICLVVSAWALVACAGAQAPRTAEPAVQALPIEGLSLAAKQATIATSFPAEIPVPMGDFTRAEAQGEDAWDYEVQIPSKPDDVLAWYRTQYVVREWIVVKEGQFDAVDGSGTFLDLRKNRAESSISIYSDYSEGYTLVKAVVGVGTPVLQSQ